MRIHRATPEFIREMKALGYEGLSADDLVSMRIHGVSLEYARDVKQRYNDATVYDVVSMRIHGRR